METAAADEAGRCRRWATKRRMLDTAKYRADCAWVFGFFLDHFPCFGFRGEADRRAWHGDFARTRRLFAAHFGLDIGGQPAASACTTHGDGSGCCVGRSKPRQPMPGRALIAARSPPGMPGVAEPVASPGGDHLHGADFTERAYRHDTVGDHTMPDHHIYAPASFPYD